MVLTAKLAYLLALCGAQSIRVPAYVTVGLRDPVADRLGGGFELTSQLFRSPSGANQLNHLAPEGRRVRRPRFRHSDYLLPKGSGVHEIGSTPALAWASPRYGAEPGRREPNKHFRSVAPSRGSAPASWRSAVTRTDATLEKVRAGRRFAGSVGACGGWRILSAVTVFEPPEIGWPRGATKGGKTGHEPHPPGKNIPHGTLSGISSSVASMFCTSVRSSRRLLWAPTARHSTSSSVRQAGLGWRRGGDHAALSRGRRSPR